MGMYKQILVQTNKCRRISSLFCNITFNILISIFFLVIWDVLRRCRIAVYWNVFFLYSVFLDILRFDNIFILSHPVHFTVTVYCYLFLWCCGSSLFRRSDLSCALTDNTSSVLKEKVPQHRGSYVIRHKWYCQVLFSACSLRIILFASLQHMAESNASTSRVFGVLTTSNTGNGNESSRKVDITFVFIIFEH